MLSTVTLINPDIEIKKFSKLYHRIIPYCRHITVYTDKRDQPLHFSQIINKQKSLGIFRKSFKDLTYLDIVDCSTIEHNTNWTYHTYFFSNLSIVGDIRELIISKRRAKYRMEKLIQRHVRDNSFQFKSVPTGAAFA